jgi:hypothetical protein
MATSKQTQIHNDVYEDTVHNTFSNDNDPYHDRLVYNPPDGVICLDEIQESITMPTYDARTISVMNDRDYVDSIKLCDGMMNDLREYVTLIANSYNDNPFHNFEHACHVTM